MQVLKLETILCFQIIRRRFAGSEQMIKSDVSKWGVPLELQDFRGADM